MSLATGDTSPAVESAPPLSGGYVSNYVPREMDQHLDFLEFTEAGDLLLGTSSLNRRYWTGTVWWYSSPELAPSVASARTGVQLEAGVVRGRRVGTSQLLLALDSGAVQLVNLLTGPHELKEGVDVYSLELLLPVLEHEDCITDMDTWLSSSSSSGGGGGGGESLAVTVSRDRRICVWARSLALLHSYHPGHNSDLSSVSCAQHHTNMFATAGLDGAVKVWDTRKEKPAMTVYTSQELPPGLVSHDRVRENQLLVAARTGDLFSLDIRSPGQKTEPVTYPFFDRELRTMAWCPERPNLVAVAGDDTTVSVLEVGAGELREAYRSTAHHTDFVRGLAWDPSSSGRLWSCGWDQIVAQHTLPQL